MENKSTNSVEGNHSYSESSFQVLTEELVNELNAYHTSSVKLYDQHLPPTKPDLEKLTWNDVAIESILGEGAFSLIFQVAVAKRVSDSAAATTDATRHANTTVSYALKCLQQKAIETTDDLRYNAMDLFLEGQLLARLSHPYIISLSGLSVEDQLAVSSSSSSSQERPFLGNSFGKAEGYFLLLEIMESTLLERLEAWRTEIEYSPRIRSKQLCSIPAIHGRVQKILIPITNALAYLHSHQIIMRDLKPENIGFTVDGTIKLFDFGLSRLVGHVSETECLAGSIGYMAPEVLQEEMAQVGTASDLYSFAIMIWECCTLEDWPPVSFNALVSAGGGGNGGTENLNGSDGRHSKNKSNDDNALLVEHVRQKVAIRKWRPSLSRIPIKPLRKVLIQAWAHSPTNRPPAAALEATLRRISSELGNGGDDSSLQSGGSSSQSQKGGGLKSLFSFRRNDKKKK